MMKKLLSILILLPSIMGYSQQYADKEYYLIDSIDLSQATEIDKFFLDSCLKVYHESDIDSIKLKAIDIIIGESWNPSIWEPYNNWLHEELRARETNRPELFDQFNIYNKLFSATYNNLGYTYLSKGETTIAQQYYDSTLKYINKVNDLRGLSTYYFNTGYMYNNQGNIEKAVEYYEKSLEISEKIGIKRDISSCLSNLGIIQLEQNNLDYAVDYISKSLKLRDEIGDTEGVAQSLTNLAKIQKKKGNRKKEIELTLRALNLFQELGDKLRVARSLQNLGVIYEELDDITNALDYYKKSLSIQEEIEDKEGKAYTLVQLGKLALKSNDEKIAQVNFEQALEISRKLGYPNLLSLVAVNMSKLLKNQDSFKEALEMYELHIQMRDSIKNEETLKASVQQQAKYEYEKQQAIKDAEHEKQLALEHKEQEKQQLITYAAGGGLLLVLAFLGFVFNRLKVTRRQKNEIDFQKQEIEKTHEQLSEHHKEIQDSINYAKRIQNAIMPNMEAMNNALGNGFVLYLPKDVVAGDFFWMEQIEDTVYFAAADCTGHGVPGAMVSVVCSNAITKALLEEGIRDTGKLLDRTRELVINQLAKSGEEVKDGMDISLCAWNKKTNQLQWSGANNPLWIVRKEANEVEEIKADKQPIGKYAGEQPFTSHSIQLNEGDSVYVFTDGYQDQFGGPKGKKFKVKQLKQTILDISNKSIFDQKMILENTFDIWKEDVEQVDDVCIIGVRV